MANVRKTYDRTDTGAPPILHSYLADGVTILYSTAAERAAAKGLCVTMSAANTVELVADADGILGVVDHVESDGTVVVHEGPSIKVKGGDSATLTVQAKIVGALGAASAKGYARAVAAATLAEVAVARGVITDAGTTTAVQVSFP